jgi:hypothetical protein
MAEDEGGESEGRIIDFGERGADYVEEEFEGSEALAARAACDEVGENTGDHRRGSKRDLHPHWIYFQIINEDLEGIFLHHRRASSNAAAALHDTHPSSSSSTTTSYARSPAMRPPSFRSSSRRSTSCPTTGQRSTQHRFSQNSFNRRRPGRGSNSRTDLLSPH